MLNFTSFYLVHLPEEKEGSKRRGGVEGISLYFLICIGIYFISVFKTTILVIVTMKGKSTYRAST